MTKKTPRAAAVIASVLMFCTGTVLGQAARVPESVYKEGYTAVKKLFSQAVVAGDIEVCKELLEKNAFYVNEADEIGLTQLHYAAMSGQTDLCRLLFQHGAKADITWKGATENHRTPLEAAIANNHTETALVLLGAISPESLKPERGRNRPPLFLAILNENAEIIKALIAKKADVNTPGKIGEVVQTPFAYAVALENIEIAQILLDAGADIRFKQGNVQTSEALFAAVLSRNYDLCSFLVESKVDLNVRYGGGKTVLHVLLSQRELFSSYRDKDPFGEVVRAFTVTGPYKQVSSPFECGFVEAKGSSTFGDERPKPDFKANRLCKLFIDAGADVNIRSKEDCSVMETLFLAQIEGIREFEDFQALLELLIASKVDVNAADKNGWTPLYYLLFYCFLDEQEDEEGLKETEITAIADKKIALFKMLIEAGADVKVADKRGNTLLHYVVRAPDDILDKSPTSGVLDYDTRGNHRLLSRRLIELLIEKGVSLSDENNDGESPLDWATQGTSSRGASGMGGMGGFGGAVPSPAALGF